MYEYVFDFYKNLMTNARSQPPKLETTAEVISVIQKYDVKY